MATLDSSKATPEEFFPCTMVPTTPAYNAFREIQDEISELLPMIHGGRALLGESEFTKQCDSLCFAQRLFDSGLQRLEAIRESAELAAHAEWGRVRRTEQTNLKDGSLA